MKRLVIHSIAYKPDTDEYFCPCGNWKLAQQEAMRDRAKFEKSFQEHILEKEKPE